MCGFHSPNSFTFEFILFLFPDSLVAANSCKVNF